MPNCSKTGATQPQPISGDDCIFTRYRFACAGFQFSFVSRYKVKGFNRTRSVVQLKSVEIKNMQTQGFTF